MYSCSSGRVVATDYPKGIGSRMYNAAIYWRAEMTRECMTVL